MKIKNVHIENILSFGIGDEALDMNLSDINYIVGTNNSGKTNFNRALHFFFNSLNHEIISFINNDRARPYIDVSNIIRDGDIKKEFKIEISFVLNDRDKNDIYNFFIHLKDKFIERVRDSQFDMKKIFNDEIPKIYKDNFSKHSDNKQISQVIFEFIINKDIDNLRKAIDIGEIKIIMNYKGNYRYNCYYNIKIGDYYINNSNCIDTNPNIIDKYGTNIFEAFRSYIENKCQEEYFNDGFIGSMINDRLISFVDVNPTSENYNRICNNFIDSDLSLKNIDIGAAYKLLYPYEYLINKIFNEFAFIDINRKIETKCIYLDGPLINKNISDSFPLLLFKLKNSKYVSDHNLYKEILKNFKYFSKGNTFHVAFESSENINEKDEHNNNISELKNKFDIKNICHLYFINNDKIYSFDRCGSGMLELLYNIYAITCQNIILLDEPVNNIHPSLQKEFISYIRKLIKKSIDKQIIIITHSPYILPNINKKLNDKIFYFRYFNDNTYVKEIEYHHISHDLEKHLKTIELRKEIFFSTNNILVEGLSDKLVIEDIIYNKYDNYNFTQIIDCYGGNSSIFLSEILSNWGIINSVIIDQDKESDIVDKERMLLLPSDIEGTIIMGNILWRINDIDNKIIINEMFLKLNPSMNCKKKNKAVDNSLKIQTILKSIIDNNDKESWSIMFENDLEDHIYKKITNTITIKEIKNSLLRLNKFIEIKSNKPGKIDAAYEIIKNDDIFFNNNDYVISRIINFIKKQGDIQ